MRRAVVDIGTHTFLLLIVETGQSGKPTVIREEERFVGLGRGVPQGGAITEEAVKRGCAALAEYAAFLKAEGVGEVRAVATAVLRHASNTVRVRAELEKAAGFPIVVISGEEEARLVYLAAARALTGVREMTVVDIGGGSVEFTSGQGEGIEKRVSLPLGAIVLTERFLKRFPVPEQEFLKLQAFIKQALSDALRDFDCSRGRRLVGVSGTFTTVASMEQGLAEYRPEKLTGFRLKKEAMAGWLSRLAGMALKEQRKIPGLKPQRAGLIVAGLAVALAACEYFNAEEITVCNEGLRFGVLFDNL